MNRPPVAHGPVTRILLAAIVAITVLMVGAVVIGLQVRHNADRIAANAGHIATNSERITALEQSSCTKGTP